MFGTACLFARAVAWARPPAASSTRRRLVLEQVEVEVASGGSRCRWRFMTLRFKLKILGFDLENIASVSVI